MWVAQIFNLLYRRLAAGKAWPEPAAEVFEAFALTTFCGLQICDTAECNSALQGLVCPVPPGSGDRFSLAQFAHRPARSRDDSLRFPHRVASRCGPAAGVGRDSFRRRQAPFLRAPHRARPLRRRARPELRLEARHLPPRRERHGLRAQPHVADVAHDQRGQPHRVEALAARGEARQPRPLDRVALHLRWRQPWRPTAHALQGADRDRHPNPLPWSPCPATTYAACTRLPWRSSCRKPRPTA